MTSPLITFSPNALAHIAQIRAARESGQGMGFRLGLKLAGCTGWLYQPNIVDGPKPEDISFEYEGLTVIIPGEHKALLAGTHVDLEEKGLGQQVLMYQNPNAQGECGCGESFSVVKSEGSEHD